jgi:hypothetical protein
MRCIKNLHIIEYLWERGLIPVFETDNGAFYKITADLNLLLDNYFVRYICIPNKL